MVDEFFESRIGAKWVEDRIDPEFERVTVALLSGLCQPGKGLFLVARLNIGNHIFHRRRVLAPAALAFNCSSLFCANARTAASKPEAA